MTSTGGSFGEQRSIVRVGPFVLSETRHPRGFVAPMHVHERASLNVVLAGGYAETVGGASPTVVPEGGALAKPAWEAHANHFRHAGARCLLIEIPPAEEALLRRVTDVFDVPDALDARPAGMAVGALALALRQGAGGRVDALVAECLAHEVVVELARASRAAAERRPDAWLCRVREMLHDLPPAAVTLTRLASEVGRHPAHVARAFHARHGCTVGAFLRRLQVARAGALLGRTDAGISRIAVEVGFYDHSHLTREFRRRTGLTPREFRSRSRAGDRDSASRVDH